MGERLLPREEFQTIFEQRMGTMPQSPPLEMLNQLHQQVWNELLQRELLLNAAEQSQVVVHEVEVSAEIERIKAGHPDFNQLLSERFGNLGAFSRQLKNDMIISKLLDCDPTEVVFTSGGSESNNHALKGVLSCNRMD